MVRHCPSRNMCYTNSLGLGHAIAPGQGLLPISASRLVAG